MNIDQLLLSKLDAGHTVRMFYLFLISAIPGGIPILYEGKHRLRKIEFLGWAFSKVVNTVGCLHPILDREPSSASSLSKCLRQQGFGRGLARLKPGTETQSKTPR